MWSSFFGCCCCCFRRRRHSHSHSLSQSVAALVDVSDLRLTALASTFIHPIFHVEMYQNSKSQTARLHALMIFYYSKFRYTEAGSCWTPNGAGHCIHGRCVASEDGSTFSCQCDPGYSGEFCTDSKSLCSLYFIVLFILSFHFIPSLSISFLTWLPTDFESFLVFSSTLWPFWLMKYCCRLVAPCLLLSSTHHSYRHVCPIDVNDCADNPCRNGATCIDGIDSFHCVCPKGYEGLTCDQSKFSLFFLFDKINGVLFCFGLIFLRSWFVCFVVEQKNWLFIFWWFRCGWLCRKSLSEQRDVRRSRGWFCLPMHRWMERPYLFEPESALPKWR